MDLDIIEKKLDDIFYLKFIQSPYNIVQYSFIICDICFKQLNIIVK